jgi:hypothetical protein
VRGGQEGIPDRAMSVLRNENSSCSRRLLPIIFNTMHADPISFESRRALTAITAAMFAIIILLCGCGDNNSNPSDGNNPPPASATNRVRLGCPVTLTSPAVDTAIALDIYLTSDSSIAGFQLGFHYNSPDVEIAGVSRASVLGTDSAYVAAYPDSNLLLVLWFSSNPSNTLPPLDDEKAFSLLFFVPAGIAPQSVDVDSAFVAPSGRFIFAFEDGSASPGFDDCGTADIVVEEAPQRDISPPEGFIKEAR